MPLREGDIHKWGGPAKVKQTDRVAVKNVGYLFLFFNLRKGREGEGENECWKNERGGKGRIVTNIFYLLF